MNDFDEISGKYREKSLVQQKAALKLFNILKIVDSDDIIDIACGPGHVTKWLGNATRGRVVGIDISEGMIKQAKSLYPDIEFRQIKKALFWGYEMQGGLYVAKPEKALLDLVYLASRGMAAADLDELDLRKLSMKTLKDLSKRFPEYTQRYLKKMLSA